MEKEKVYVTPVMESITMNSTQVLCDSDPGDAILVTEMQQGDDNW